MNELVASMNHPLVMRTGWVLIHFLWQGALIAALAEAMLILTRKASSSLRYLLLCGAMVLCVALPIATWFCLKPIKIESVAKTPRLAIPSVQPLLISRPSFIATQSSSPVIPREGGNRRSFALESFAFLKERNVLEASLPYVVLIWVAGVLALSARMLLGWRWLEKLKRSGIPVNTAAWLQRMDSLQKRMRISRTVRLLQSTLVEVPTLIGWLRPVILVPVSFFSSLPPDQIEAILAHELAHVRRFDYFVNWVQTVIETVLFYHPAVWWIGRKLREEREHCCDDLALELVRDRVVYVSALAALEESRTAVLSLAVTGDSDGSLLKRIRRIVSGPTFRSPLCSKGGILFVLFLAVLALGAGAGIYFHKSKKSVSQDVYLTMTLFEIADDVYNANRAEIDRAISDGDVSVLEKIKGLDSVSFWRAVKTGKKSTIQMSREFRSPALLERETTGKWKPNSLLTSHVGLNVDVFPEVVKGEINLNAVLRLVDFQGFAESNMSIQVPTFERREFRIFRELNENRAQGIWLPGVRMEERTITENGTPRAKVTRIYMPMRLVAFFTAKILHKESVSSFPEGKQLEIHYRVVEVPRDILLPHRSTIDQLYRMESPEKLSRFFDQLKDVSFLSSPKVWVKNECEASIQIPKEFKYPVSLRSDNNGKVVPDKMESHDVGCTMRFLPTMRDGQIVIDCTFEEIAYEGGISSGPINGPQVIEHPIFSTNEKSFQLTMKPGETLQKWFPNRTLASGPSIPGAIEVVPDRFILIEAKLEALK